MTLAFKTLSDAGIGVYTDNRLHHIRFLEGNRTRVRRFATLQNASLSIGKDQFVGLLVCMVAFDLIPVQHVDEAIKGLHRDGMFVEWKDEQGRLNRRMLSIFSVARLGAFLKSVNELDTSSLNVWIQESGIYPRASAKKTEEELQLDSTAWAARYVPMALWAHLAGIQPLACISNACFHRYMGLAPASTAPAINQGDDEAGSLLADIIDEFTSKSSDEDAPVDLRKAIHLIDRVTEVFRSRATSKSKTGEAGFSLELLHIQGQAANMNSLVLWVICWMLDLFESGTPQKPNATFETRVRYCRVAAVPLLHGLVALGDRFHDLEGEDLEALGLALMADPSIADKQGLGAAISSFLFFVHEEFDAPLVRPQLHQFLPDITPRAQYVSTLEVRLARSWIAQQTGTDSRLQMMSNLILAMGYSAPFRRDELLKLRVGNIQKLVQSNFFEVEINGNLKTKSSVRRVLIDEPWAAQELDGWLNLRFCEGATSKDLLFGTPHTPRTVYRRSACNRLLLKVLKLATGDGAMTFHGLRHSWASRHIESVLRSSSIANFDRLAHIAYAMGHASAQMSLRFYFHHHETALKHTIDELQVAIELTADEASCITGVKPNTLTQRALRNNCTIGGLTIQLLRRAAPEVQHYSHAQNANTAPPVLLRTFSPMLTPHQVMNVMEMDQLGASGDQLIAARSGVTSSDLSRIRYIGVDLALKLSPRRKTLSMLERQALTFNQALHLTRINLNAANHVKYKALRSFIRLPIEISVAKAASDAWQAMVKHGHLDASDEVLLGTLLNLLKTAEVDPAQLMLRIEVPGLSRELIAIKLAAPIRVFIQVFGVAPRCESLEYNHPARPQITLVWTSISNGLAMVSPAATSITGFHALMFVLSVTTQYSEGNSHAVT